MKELSLFFHRIETTKLTCSTKQFTAFFDKGRLALNEFNPFVTNAPFGKERVHWERMG